MKSRLESSSWPRWAAKAAVLAIPPSMATIYFPAERHQLVFALSMLVGVLLQALIPPRKKGLLALLSAVVAICTVNFILWR